MVHLIIYIGVPPAKYKNNLNLYNNLKITIMRKNVLISLLAVTGAPVAALANADVVIDQNV